MAKADLSRSTYPLLLLLIFIVFFFRGVIEAIFAIAITRHLAGLLIERDIILLVVQNRPVIDQSVHLCNFVAGLSMVKMGAADDGRKASQGSMSEVRVTQRCAKSGKEMASSREVCVPGVVQTRKYLGTDEAE